MITITNRFMPFLNRLNNKYKWSKAIDYEMAALVIIHEAADYDLQLPDEIVRQIYAFLINKPKDAGLL
jgi:hypothetical protein